MQASGGGSERERKRERERERERERDQTPKQAPRLSVEADTGSNPRTVRS